jgi:hypothetical protein
LVGKGPPGRSKKDVMRDPLRSSLILLAGLVMGLPGGVRADQAIMADGRVLRIEAVQPLGETAWLLELEGGGKISCPRSRLLRILPDLPAEPVVEAPVRETWKSLAGEYGEAIERWSRENGLEPRLIVAVILAESNFDPLALSPKGAQGLMQLMPATAAEFEVTDPYDPEDNIRGGVSYLGWLLERYGGDLELTLAAYNAGPEAVEQHGGVPPFPETRDYIRRVLGRYQRL